MKIYSPAFDNNDQIPEKYTCDGENVNPPLRIEDLPKNTKSLALIVDDPDSASGSFTHWMVWDIPPNTDISENSVPGTEGNNSFDLPIYGGPCPPQGADHRYFFRVYALTDSLNLKKDASKQDVENAIHDHLIDSALLMGRYHRQ